MSNKIFVERINNKDTSPDTWQEGEILELELSKTDIVQLQSGELRWAKLIFKPEFGADLEFNKAIQTETAELEITKAKPNKQGGTDFKGTLSTDGKSHRLSAYPQDERNLNSALFSGIAELEECLNGAFEFGIWEKGEHVTRIQKALRLLYPDKQYKFTEGVFDVPTQQAVYAFQGDSGLTGSAKDGIIGKQTMMLFDSYGFPLTGGGSSYAIKDGALQWVDASDWELEEKETTLYFSAKYGNHYFYSGKYKVYRASGEKVEGKGDNVAGVGATGASGSRLIVTERGKAFMMDAGSKVRLAVFQKEINSLMNQLGVTEIKGLEIIHHHTDHTNRISQIISQFRIRPANLHIASYYLYKKGITKELQKLAESSETRTLGYHRYEDAASNPLSQARQGADVFRVRTQRGEIVFEYFYSKRQIEKMLEKGENASSKLEDSAQPMVRISKEGVSFKMFILGDLRGSDYLRLANNMDAVAPGSFNNLFRDVEILGGFQHHLGMVYDSKDLEGIARLMEATAYRTGNLSVVVQTDNQQMRTRLVEALNYMGVDVNMALKGSGGEGSGIVIKDNNIVEAYGKQVKVSRANPRAREALSYVASVNNAHRSMKQVLAEFPKWKSNTKVREVKDMLEKEVKRLEPLKAKQHELTLGRIAGKTKIQQSKIQFDTKAIEANTESILEYGSYKNFKSSYEGIFEFLEINIEMERNVKELEAEILAARKTGVSSGRFLRLIEEVSPRYAREVIGNSSLKSESRRARVLGTLLRQQQATRMVANSGPVPGAATRGTAWLGIFLTITNDIIIPYIEASRKLRDKNMREAYDKVMWWIEKGVVPKLRGVVDNTFSSDDFYTAYNRNLQENKVIQMLNAEELDGLEIMEIPEQEWDIFIQWLTMNVHNINDFTYYFKDDPADATGYDPTSDSQNWYLNLPKWDDGMTIKKDYNETFHKIMQAHVNRIIRNTEIELDMEWQSRNEERPAVSVGPRDNVGSELSFPHKPVRKVQFKEMGKDGLTLYTMYKQKSVSISFKSRPIFYELEKPKSSPFKFEGDVPSGYSLVVGANYDTYGQLRVANTYLFSVKEVLFVENHMEDLVVKVEDLRDDESNYDSLTNDEIRYIFAREDHTAKKIENPAPGFPELYHWPGWGPSSSAVWLVKSNDIEEVKE